MRKALLKDCKLWKATKDKDGYGFVKLYGKQVRVHRVALEIKIGRKLNNSEIAMHLCNNPSCFEKTHLKVGTVKENNRAKRNLQVTLADKYLKGWKQIYT